MNEITWIIHDLIEGREWLFWRWNIKYQTESLSVARQKQEK